MKNLLLLFSLLYFHSFFSQKTERFNIKKYQIATLDDSLKESSGLDFFNGNLYTFNDSGNTAELFQISLDSGKIQKKIETNLRNEDWEALCNNGKNFYIGDIGNNQGTRKDLKIYKFPIDSAQNVQTISFYYPEQSDFTPKNLNNDFDAEALVFLDGKIHLFTKEWKSKETTHYILDPTNFELQKAEKKETFKTNFVVTDAAYFEDKLYLIGYTKTTSVFLEIFQRSEDDYFFKKPAKKYKLGSAFSLSQIEGIAVNKNGIYISGEEFKTPLGDRKGKFYFIPKDDLN